MHYPIVLSGQIDAAVRRGPVGFRHVAFARRASPYVTASPRAVQESPAKAIPNRFAAAYVAASSHCLDDVAAPCGNRCRCGVCGARRGAQRQPSGCTGIDLLGIALAPPGLGAKLAIRRSYVPLSPLAQSQISAGYSVVQPALEDYRSLSRPVAEVSRGRMLSRSLLVVIATIMAA